MKLSALALGTFVLAALHGSVAFAPSTFLPGVRNNNRSHMSKEVRPLHILEKEREAVALSPKPPGDDKDDDDKEKGDAADADGLPWWWDAVWKLDVMKRGEEGKEIIFGDSAHVLRTNIEQIYGAYPS
jgi:hypothetical protein